MFLNKYHHLKNKEIYILIFLIIFSILIRIPAIHIFGDASLVNEWKDIVNNLIESRQLLYKGEPNLFMPPLYALYLYFFSFFNLDSQSYIQLILISQVMLASISIAIFYKLSKFFFSPKVSFIGSLLYSLFPLHIYACAQISSITLQVFLTILFFYYFFSITIIKKFSSIILLSIVAGLLMLLRGEFIIIFLVSLMYLLFFFKTSIKNIVLITLIALITISPYLIRNVLIFDTVTITKSFGYNLWKGNNPDANVEGFVIPNAQLQKKIDNIPNDKYYPINLDNIYLDEAVKNIKENPKRYLVLFFKKIISFLFIDIKSSDPNYYNFFHYMPIAFIGITSVIGIILSDKKSYKFNYLLLIFFISIAIFSSFFILPRYKLAILPFQIIFTNILVEYIYRKFLYRNE